MRAVLYCRVSTTEQASNLSLPTQEKACREYCAKQGYEVGEVFIDAGESAKSTDRPEFLRLLTYCREQKSRVHAVIVYSLTRFSRNSADHHAITTLLRGLGITLRSVTEPIDESPSGRLMEGILAAMAQFDNDVKSERVTVGMQAARALGRWVSRPPLGYLNGPRTGPSLIPDPVRAQAVRQAFALFAAGLRGRALIQRLTAMGLRTTHGNPLTKQTLYMVLRNRAYIGYLRSPGSGCGPRGDFDPLIPEDTFTRVQQRLLEAPTSTRAIARHRNHPDFPLRRFARCGVCDRPLSGSWSKGRGRRYAFYHCRAGCTRTPAPALEAVFLQLLDRLRPQEAYWSLFKATFLRAWEHARRTRTIARAELQRQITALEHQGTRLDRTFIFERLIDADTYHAERDRIREELAIARIEFADATSKDHSVEEDLAFAGHVLTQASVLWTAAGTVDARQRLQWAMFPRGIIVTRGSTSQERSPSAEPIITAVSCLEFFQLPDGSSGEGKDGAAYWTNIEPGVLAWLAQMRALRLAA